MAREHLFKARTVWTGARQGPTSSYAAYSREYTFSIEGKPDLTGSAAVPYRGDASLPNPEEHLLAALSACHMLSYLAICALEKISVVAYEDECTATMAMSEGKMRIVEATVRPKVTLAEGSDIERAESFHTKANGECFIANSVNFPVHHEATTVAE